jgi:hypothetical protein
MKKFIWCERTSSTINPIRGPHKVEWQKIIGQSYVHTLEDICKLPISDVLKYRLDSAAEGVIIGIHHIHANVDLAVRRISEKEEEVIREEKTLKNALARTCAIIAEKEPALHKEKLDLENKLSLAQQRVRDLHLEGIEFND